MEHSSARTRDCTSEMRHRLRLIDFTNEQSSIISTKVPSKLGGQKETKMPISALISFGDHLSKDKTVNENANSTQSQHDVHPYELCKKQIKLSANRLDISHLWHLCQKFDALEKIVANLGSFHSNGILYRSLFCLYIFRNVSGAPNAKEMQLAIAGLCQRDVDNDTVETIASSKVVSFSVVSKIRSEVGLKVFQEVVMTNWQLAVSSDKYRYDPPLYSIRINRNKQDQVSRDEMAAPTKTILKSFENALGVTIRWPCNRDMVLNPKFVRRIRWKKANLEDVGTGTRNELNSNDGVSLSEIATGGDIDELRTALTVNVLQPSSSQSNQTLTAVELFKVISGLYEECDSIYRHMIELLTSERSDGALQSELIDLLGVEQFDMVASILESRVSLTEELNAMKGEGKKQSKLTQLMVCSCGRSFLLIELLLTALKDADDTASSAPQYCQQVTVQSKMESELRRELRKEQKRANKEFNRITHAFGEEEKLEIELARRDIMKQRQLELLNTQWVQLSSSDETRVPLVPREHYPYVFDAALSGEQTDLTLNGLKFALPSGSKRISHHTYDEVNVPPSDTTSIQDVRHVYVKDMDELGQIGFKGYEKLNVIQSLVFEQAYKTKENLLICAPTGAGSLFIGYIGIHKRLSEVGLKVRELTGDTTLSKREIAETQMLILTPEKWDVVTRKDSETSLARLMRLLIIDEVHLLHDDRGHVIETIVARTLRQVEMSQQGIRIIGLSATLPNYVDVARFLRVNPYKGLFFFDSRFRPVPLAQTFIGVRKPVGSLSSSRFSSAELDEVCYEKVHQFAKQGHQVLVFVHARNATAKLASFFRDKSSRLGHFDDFLPSNITTKGYMASKKAMTSSHNLQLIELFQFGFGIHHAGLPRRNRLMIEKLFASGHIKILFCTATLAWGVNLPAHAVVIRGTDVFDAQKGAFTDIGVLDVQQIFGRAGRPQYESSGHGVIITWQKKIDKYLNMLIRQTPIESQFMAHIHDNLNAEIALGTVSNINEAVEWLSYSYYSIRSKLNPLAYGIPYNQLENDPELKDYLTKIMNEAAEKLDMNQMIRFDSVNGFVNATDLGRIASHYYVKFETIEMLNTGVGNVKLTQLMTDDNVINLIANASEFSQIRVREEESEDLEQLKTYCPLRLKQGALATVAGKINCLMQAYLSRVNIRSFSLLSEMLYIEQNSGRLCRAMFEIVLRRGWAHATNAFLCMAKCLEKRVWPFQTPLRQIEGMRIDVYDKIERKKLSFYQLCEMTAQELGSMLSYDGQRMYDAIRMLPSMYIEASVKPITNTIIQITLSLTPGFTWNDHFLGSKGAQSFWVFIENINENMIIHFEKLIVNKKKVKFGESQTMIFTIPIRDQQLSHNYQVRVASDYYVVDDSVLPISMHNCVLPYSHRPHTDLLDLDPLPIKALKNASYESIYSFEYFNPIQTQVFYCLYNTDQNALIGAPTGSGKTLCAELAMYRVFNKQPHKKVQVCIYELRGSVIQINIIAMFLGRCVNICRIVELTGDHTPDIRSLRQAQLVITTPEKWDGITRSWEVREYVRDVVLVVIDEIHLLGVERGAVLEAIITRLKLMAMKRRSDGSNTVRVVGLSTALANAGDIAEWLNIKESGLFNFRPNVRPVPIEVHIAGFPGQQYCPRMALMNRPAFKAIQSYSPSKPVLVFVASRRQTRLTAMAFVSQLVSGDDPKQWLNMDIQELECLTQTIKDESLKLTLPFGIGMHHAGLQQHERSLVEELFVERKIQVLIATATLAWGINMPAHLVIIKGTEYYDGKTHKYVNFPVTDVLQMMGRAGRPQYDTSAIAVIYVQDVKKNFYKRFLYEPFPVESRKQKWRKEIIFYFSYYEIEETSAEALTSFLVDVVDGCVDELLLSKCISIDESRALLKEDQTISSTPLGRIASMYYLQHETVRFFSSTLSQYCS
ncbi:unnamed protein product, partial [Anisakis simplex]|uniref:Activating signal cointegrator 1 complex subunit 3 (inferred by orthology to a zebrafish protein) n=1 Tax=Anisakis simplex TaxID=6269 RepID=A0A0M3K379_ANISI